jgi:SAM-dependent methyltransferase
MDLKSTYNKIAKDWERDHHVDTWWIEGTDKYLSFLASGASILDVGCGAGEKSKYLLNKGFKVTGVDFSEEMLAIAKEQAPSGTFMVCDITQPLDLVETFDGVFAQAVLLHIPKKNIINVIRSITASLVSGGYFYLAVKETKPNSPDEAVLKENDYGYEYERFFSYYSLDELKRYIQDCGMELVYENVTTSGRTNWIQVIARKSL